MIRTKYGTTRIEGNIAELMADFHIITKSIKTVLVEHEEMSEEDAKEKIRKEVEESISDEDTDDFDEKILGLIKELINTIEESRDETDGAEFDD